MSLQRQYGTEIAIAIEYQTFKKLSTNPFINVVRVPFLRTIEYHSFFNSCFYYK
ncbi:hypothetical protein [Brochothrix thermosphacta]|uniref:hypothetical protein n=1 Tax=Brochothrix thermosphacta TaxID=2756 RepID=UPI00241CA0CA|nr:hypothetical protein [Brochothrix thermosphacta]